MSLLESVLQWIRTSVSWLIPVGILIASWFIGFWLKRALVPRLTRWAERTAWDGDDLLAHAVNRSIVLWSLLAGAYVAIRLSDIPDSVIDLTGRVLPALWITSLTWIAASVIGELITRYTRRRQLGLPMTSLTQNFARIIILSLGALLVLESLGVKITALLAALGIGSLAVALGLQDTLSNLFAGVYVSLSKNIQVNDYIKLESGQEGYVKDIGWRATTIHMLPDNIIIVPNAKISQSIITNYYLPTKEIIVLVEVGVEYASDLERVERVTIEVAREVLKTVQGGVASFEPVVRFHTFAESSVNFTVVLRGKEFVDQYLIKHEFLKRLHARYAREGIVIPFPSRTVHLKSDQR